MPRVRELLTRTRQRLRSLGVYNVQFRRGDGWDGWKKYAPYDGILVAAAAPELPQKLLEQLTPGGTLIIPIHRPRVAADAERSSRGARRAATVRRHTVAAESFSQPGRDGQRQT